MIAKAKSKSKTLTTTIRDTLWLLSLFTTMIVCATPAHAGIAGSKIGTGLNRLISDISAYLKVISPITMVVLLIYFFIRKGMADEMDAKKWNTRIVTAIVCCVGAFVASVIVDLAQAYFG